MYSKKILTKEEAQQKIKSYCAYQERSHSEVKEKLYSFGLHRKDVDDILSKLIEDNYLNEERFAILYAGGKFRMKQWGRKKIEYELRQKNVSAYCIKVALKQIPSADYYATLEKLASQKWNSLKGNRFVRQSKTTAYLMQKGYESSLISEVLKNLQE